MSHAAVLTVLAMHGIAWLCVTAYALYNAWLACEAWRANRASRPRPAPPADWPSVTVQLPVYNEPGVQRLLEAVAALRYPRDRFEIQLLDDSAPAFAHANAALVRGLQARNVPITHVCRTQREGYKAGALASGLVQANGDLLLLLDADFTPEADLLERLVPWFNDARVAMVQARWGNAPARNSVLTRCAAYWIERHFHVDQLARSRCGQFFHFNGSAGMWRRRAVDDAGGWRADTLAEDMDLSFRAWRRGWRFVYDYDTVVPAQIPPDAEALRIQQRRWACGTFQVTKDVLPNLVLRGRLNHAIGTFFHLTGYCFPMLLCALALMAGVGSALATQPSVPRVLLLDLPASLFSTYLALRTAACWYSGGWRCARLELEAAAMGIGLVPIVVAGSCAAFTNTQQTFHRTPKTPQAHGGHAHTVVACAELLLAWACAFSATAAIHYKAWCMVLLPMLATWGLGAMAVSTLKLQVLASFKPSRVAAQGGR